MMIMNLLRIRKGCKKGIGSLSFDQVERRAYDDLESRRASSLLRFDLPVLNIHSSHADLSSLDVVDRYSVGASTIYITGDYKYIVNDPPLTQQEQESLLGISSKLLFLIPVSMVNDESKFEEYVQKAGLDEPRFKYLLKREVLGYGKLEPMVRDAKVEDIVVPSASRHVSCTHSDYGIMPTNVSFEPAELDRYLERLVHLSGKSVSLFRPILSIRLPNGDRLSASYKKEVSVDGSNFIIRKFPEKPWSITSLMLLNTIPPEMAAWLMLLEEYKKAFLVCGAMGTGKTSMINALCNLIPERSVIVTIEDTPELKLAHPNRFSLVVRESVTLDEKGDIGMFALVKEALRMSADHLVVGEVRGEEARVWAQAIMTGHGGVTSLHSESPRAAIQRLLSPPISVERGALGSLGGILYITRTSSRMADRVVQRRRAINFFDVGNDLSCAPLFNYDSSSDSFSADEGLLASSNIAGRIMEEAGITKSLLIEKYRARVSFLGKLKRLSKLQPEFRDYLFVAKAVWRFQSSDDFDPESIMISDDGSLGTINAYEASFSAKERRAVSQILKPSLPDALCERSQG
jgi:flagellar protein FlaI